MVNDEQVKTLTNFLTKFCKENNIKDIKISFSLKNKTLITDYNIFE